MPVFNYSDYTNELRDIICSNHINPIIANSAAAANCADSSQIPTFPRMSIRMDADSIRNALEGMTQNAVFGDLAVLRDRSPRDRYHADILRRLEDDYRRWEVERIKKLISSKATIRYIVEVK